MTETRDQRDEVAQRRRVQPVPDEPSPEDVFDPESSARPALAVWLAVGPVLGGLGVIGWLRLLSGVRHANDLEWSGLQFLGDAVLLMLFIIPHSLLARGWGRRLLNRPFGPGAERPLYVLITGLTLSAMVFLWRDTGPLLWEWNGLFYILARALQISGLLLASWGVLVVGASHITGLAHLRALESGRPEPSPELIALPPYAWIRQPVNLGLLLLLAGMTEITPDRLLMMICMGAWLLLVAPIEERDAELNFGEGYARYRDRTPRWFPGLRSPQQ